MIRENMKNQLMIRRVFTPTKKNYSPSYTNTQINSYICDYLLSDLLPYYSSTEANRLLAMTKNLN